MPGPRIALVSLASLALAAAPAWAGTFKCRAPDGTLGYQETPCPADSDGEELTPDTRPPSGAAARSSADYSVQSQLKALEADRRKARRKHAKESSGTARAAKKDTKKESDRHDAARCAKNRAEAARWRREVRNGYQDRDQREREVQMLKYHEVLVERYCGPGD